MRQPGTLPNGLIPKSVLHALTVSGMYVHLRGNSGFVVGDREREALLKLPQRWKKQNAALLFPTLLGKVQDNFSTAPTTPTAKLSESFWEGTVGSHARPSTL